MTISSVAKITSYNFPKDKLERLYLTEKLSTYSIAAKWHCDPKTIYVYLLRYGIPTRPRKVVNIDPKTLSDLYQSGKSMATIGRLYGICPAAIHRKIHRSNISTRNQWEANIKYTQKDFSGSNESKAYLIGFRVGDLNVRTKTDPTCGITVKSGTTKKAQLELMTALFIKYGHIWISGPHSIGEYQFETRLNRSFDFLLPKHSFIPAWIMDSDDYFWSFVAGYTDAEGNISLCDNRAKFRIRTCEPQILKQIHDRLHQLGIKSLYGLERKKGLSKTGKLKLNKDCWGVTVNHAPSLVSLFGYLKPRLLHKKRYGDLLICIRNLDMRGYLH